MHVLRFRLLVAACVAGGLGCATSAPHGVAPEPQTPEVRDRSLADVVVASFQWAAQNRAAGLRTAFWTSLYMHFEIRSPDAPGGPNIQELAAGTAATVQSLLVDRVADSIAQRLVDDVHLTPFNADATCPVAATGGFASTPSGRLVMNLGVNANASCHFQDLDALIGLTNLDVRGDAAAAGIYVAYDVETRGAATQYGSGTGNDAVCLKLSRRGGQWSVTGSGSWAFDGGPPICK